MINLVQKNKFKSNKLLLIKAVTYSERKKSVNMHIIILCNYSQGEQFSYSTFHSALYFKHFYISIDFLAVL